MAKLNTGIAKHHDFLMYERFLESAPDAMVAIDQDGDIVAANSRVHDLFEIVGDDLVGHPVETLLPERFRQHHVSHRRAYSANPNPRPMGIGMELWALSRSGREFPVEISLSPVTITDTRFTTAAIRDITARAQVEKELRQAKEVAEQASESKSHFLAAAGHDLRQPLQAMRMYLAALHENSSVENQAYLLDRMERSNEILAEILDALLDIARLDMGQIQPQLTTFPVEAVIGEQVADALPHALTKHLEIRTRDCDHHISTDQGLLGRIISNLLSNAIRYTQNGGILVGCQKRGERLRIGVWDTGSGIPAESATQIFEEYIQLDNPERNRNNGLGLGLSIVRRLSELLNLRILLRSNPGRGSMFAIEVPLASAENTETGDSLSQGITTRQGVRVLFIEDDPEVMEATSLILQLRGFEVHSASDGTQAYRHINELELDPDIILSDFRLPGDENGAEVVANVRHQLDREVPVVFMTGDTSEARIRETAMTFCDVLHKPLDAEKLSNALNQSIARSGGLRDR